MVSRRFVNSDFKLCLVEQSDKSYNYYEDDNLLYNFKPEKIKKFMLPIDPIRYNDTLVLLDYDKGIEIISGEKLTFINIRAVWNAFVLDGYLIAITMKKMFVIDLKSKTIVNDFFVSENCSIFKTNKGVFLYRFYRNHSYLYKPDTKEMVELNGIGKEDLFIMKVGITDNRMVLLTDTGLMIYDFSKQYILMDIEVAETYGTGGRYMDCFELTINNNVFDRETHEQNNFIKARYVYQKYGQFMLTRIFNSKDFAPDNSLSSILFEQEKLLDKTPIESKKDLEKFKENYIDLGKQFNQIFNIS